MIGFPLSAFAIIPRTVLSLEENTLMSNGRADSGENLVGHKMPKKFQLSSILSK